MKKILPYSVLICLLIMVACQKGIHWDLASEGALLKDSSGNCMPVTVIGNFIMNQSTNDSDFLLVSVDVTSAGTYSIISDSINGYIFKATGIFNNTGVIAVKLTCSGTPLIAGTDYFNIHYNNSSCGVMVNVLSDTIPASSYTLQGAPGNCMDETVQGSYLQAVTLDTSNKIIVSVNVITTGKYSILTNIVNGYSFSGKGIFTTAGVQSVIITGSGTPLNKGDDDFIVTADNNICSLTVPVAAVVAVNSELHFPLTAGSYWTYSEPVFNDTIKRYVNGDSLINDTDFIRLSELSKYTPQSYFYNFNGVDYNEFGKVEKYNTSFGYSPPVYGLLPFLKEYVTTGTSWESGEFKGTASYGQVLYFKYGYYCLSGIATKVVNGFGFKNVYIITVYPQLKSEGNRWGSTNEVYKNYYAKGVGLICVEESVNNNDFHPILQIVDWKVN